MTISFDFIITAMYTSGTCEYFTELILNLLGYFWKFYQKEKKHCLCRASMKKTIAHLQLIEKWGKSEYDEYSMHFIYFYAQFYRLNTQNLKNIHSYFSISTINRKRITFTQYWNNYSKFSEAASSLILCMSYYCR